MRLCIKLKGIEVLRNGAGTYLWEIFFTFEKTIAISRVSSCGAHARRSTQAVQPANHRASSGRLTRLRHYL